MQDAHIPLPLVFRDFDDNEGRGVMMIMTLITCIMAIE